MQILKELLDHCETIFQPGEDGFEGFRDLDHYASTTFPLRYRAMKKREERQTQRAKKAKAEMNSQMEELKGLVSASQPRIEQLQGEVVEVSQLVTSLRRSLTAEQTKTQKLERAAKSAKEAGERAKQETSSKEKTLDKSLTEEREKNEKLQLAVKSLEQRLAATQQATDMARDEAQLQQTASR
jgi:chromosome segregation ATPase